MNTAGFTIAPGTNSNPFVDLSAGPNRLLKTSNGNGSAIRARPEPGHKPCQKDSGFSLLDSLRISFPILVFCNLLSRAQGASCPQAEAPGDGSLAEARSSAAPAFKSLLAMS
jgi:hypothetical protein